MQITKKCFSFVIVTRYGPKNNAVGKNNVQLASAVVPSYLPNLAPPSGRVPGSMRLSAFIHRLWEKLTPVLKLLLTNSHVSCCCNYRILDEFTKACDRYEIFHKDCGRYLIAYFMK